MGKNLIQQARGKGSHTYKAPSFKYRAEVKYTNKYSNGIVVDFVKCRGHSAPLAQIKFEDGEIVCHLKYFILIHIFLRNIYNII